MARADIPLHASYFVGGSRAFFGDIRRIGFGNIAFHRAFVRLFLPRHGGGKPAVRPFFG